MSGAAVEKKVNVWATADVKSLLDETAIEVRGRAGFVSKKEFV